MKFIQTAPAKATQVRADGGALLRTPAGHEKEIFGGELETTNNRMELTAVIRAIESLKYPCAVALYLDSEYVRKGITEWVHGWKARGWRTAAKQPEIGRASCRERVCQYV